MSNKARKFAGHLLPVVLDVPASMRRADQAAAAWIIRTRWRWLTPLGLALMLYWPLFLPGYRLNGGFAHEIQMVNGLRSVFNQSLLDGYFIFWNEWVASGKIFLIFGAYPLNFMTPFELIFGPNIDVALYKVELVIVAMIGAALFLWLARAFSLRLVAAAFGFFSCYLMGQMPYQTGLVMSANFYLWGSAAVTCTLLYFATGNSRLTALFLVFAFLSALGARPDVYPMLLLFLGSLVVLRFCEKLLMQPGNRLHALRSSLVEMLIFGVLPLAFYAWQLPLVFALTKTAGARLWTSNATLRESAEYFFMAVRLSEGGRILLCWLLGLAAFSLILLVARQWRSLPRAASYSPTKSIATAILAAIISLGMVWAILSLSGPAQFLSIVALAAVFARALCQRFSGESSKTGRARFRESIAHQLELRVAWIWPIAIAGTHSALVEDPMMTSANIDIFFVVRVAFLFCIFYATGHTTIDRDSKRAVFLRYLVLCIGLGWIFRDFLSLPLYDALNVVWAVPRDMFWFVPGLSILFVFGCDYAIGDLQRVTTFLIKSKPSSHRSRPDHLRALGIFGGGALLVLAGCNVLTVFYVPAGMQHRSEVWNHMSRNQVWAATEKWIQRDRLYRQSLQNCGMDARILVAPLAEIGFPGAEAGGRIRNAGGYDFVGDNYRALAEAAFELPLHAGQPTVQLPRLWYYNETARRVYRLFTDRFPDLKDMEAIYFRYLMYPRGSQLDPFFLQIMRVCGVMLARSASPLEPFEAQQPSPWGDFKTYVRSPARKPARFGFLPANGQPVEELLKTLQSDDRAVLVGLYDKLVLADEVGTKSLIEVAKNDSNPDQFFVRIKTDQPGILIIFDAWDPNWIAWRNGTLVSVDRAFVAMRALAVEKGVSDIDFQYRVPWVLPALLLSIAALAFSTWWGYRAIRNCDQPGEKLSP